MNDPRRKRRSEERKKEDDSYQSVILKRTDEIRRHPDDILETAIDEGMEQLHRPPLSLFLSAVSAGLVLCFTAMSVGVTSAAAQNAEPAMLQRLATALVYPLGFIVCMMSGVELFTEHTATALYPVLDRRAPVPALLRLWTLILCGNLAGAVLGATLITLAEPVIGARQGYIDVARHLVGVEPGVLLASAILAGWLMALAAWLVLATPPTVSQLASIYVVTFLIGLGGLHHSIAGSSEMFVGLYMSNEFSIAEAAVFIGVTVVGNLIGGSFFVGLLNYGHIRETR